MTTSPADLPEYAELPELPELKMRHSWGLLPAGIGTLGLLSDGARLAAAHSMRTGQLVSLAVRTDEFDPPLFGRSALDHRVHESTRNIYEDTLDGFNPQSASQWDGLLHIRARESGFYGGVTDLEEARRTLGMHHVGALGIAGRGVLVDVPREWRARGKNWDPFSGGTVDSDDLGEILADKGVQLARGDILCLRFGWLSAYRGLRDSGGDTTAVGDRFSGLAADDRTVEWLWNNRVAAIAADNPAVEAAPGDVAVGSLHRKLLPGLGMSFAELLDLDELAASLQSPTFLFVAAPLPLAGGASSTANAVALL